LAVALAVSVLIDASRVPAQTRRKNFKQRGIPAKASSIETSFADLLARFDTFSNFGGADGDR
jgi:hypothetical protein